MHRIVDRGPVFYQFEQWPAGTGPVHGVFTRLGGVSRAPWQSLNVGSTVGDTPEAVARNKRLMAAALGRDIEQTCTVWQVHGTDTIVAEVPAPQGGVLAQADGMVSNRPGLPLVMRFADCVPILFYDSVQGAVGMAHAGWRGTVAGAGPSVIHKMVEAFGSRPADIQAAIGPSIGPECYQIGPEVVDAVQAAFGELDGLVTHADDGSTYLNLWEANRQSLVKAGVTQIEVAGLCTACHTDEFFSHRAERGQTGRFGAIIALPG